MAMPDAPKATNRTPSDPALLVEKPTLRETGTSVPTLRAQPNTPFILAHSPGDWVVALVDEKPMWVPVVMPIPIRPGACGCRTMARYEQPEQSVRDVIRWAENDGKIVIPPSTHVAAAHAGALGEGPYMRRIACRVQQTDAVGYRYIQVWDVPVATPPGEDQVFIFDSEAHTKWCVSLVETGVIPEPSELITRRMTRVAAARPQRIAGTPYPDKDLKAERKDAAQVYADNHAKAEIPGHAKPTPPTKGAKAAA